MKGDKTKTSFTTIRTISAKGSQDTPFKCNSANRLFWIIRNTDPFAIDSTQVTGTIDVTLPESCEDTWLPNLFNAWLMYVWTIFCVPLAYFAWYNYFEPTWFQDLLPPWIFAGMPVSSNKIFNL